MANNKKSNFNASIDGERVTFGLLQVSRPTPRKSALEKAKRRKEAKAEARRKAQLNRAVTNGDQTTELGEEGSCNK